MEARDNRAGGVNVLDSFHRKPYIYPVRLKFALILFFVGNAFMGAAYWSRQHLASSVKAPSIPIKDGGDPFAHEAANMQGKSYLGLAEPGSHPENLCFIRVDAKHHAQISNILWSILTMESDAELHFRPEQVRLLLPMVRRSRDGHRRATLIERILMKFLRADQANYVRRFAGLNRERRQKLEDNLVWETKGQLKPPLQEYFVWRAQIMLAKLLKPAHKVARDRWYWKKIRITGPPPPDIPVIPDFYWALSCMIKLRPELRPDPAQAWRLYWVTMDVANSILAYEGLVVDYEQAFNPEQKKFLASKVDALNHVFPP